MYDSNYPLSVVAIVQRTAAPPPHLRALSSHPIHCGDAFCADLPVGVLYKTYPDLLPANPRFLWNYTKQLYLQVRALAGKEKRSFPASERCPEGSSISASCEGFPFLYFYLVPRYSRSPRPPQAAAGEASGARISSCKKQGSAPARFESSAEIPPEIFSFFSIAFHLHLHIPPLSANLACGIALCYMANVWR